MIVDALTLLSGALSAANVASGQLLTSLGTTNSTSVYDMTGGLGAAQPVEEGQGDNQIEVTITLLQTLTSGGSPTVQFVLVQADDTGLSVNPQVICQTGAIPMATLNAAKKVVMHWDRAAPFATRRYVGLQYIVGTAALTNGTGQFFASVGTQTLDQPTPQKVGFSIA